MIKKTATSTLSALMAVALVPLSSSCGNAWIATSERENTLAALMSKADYDYDKSKFASASSGYTKVLEKDPTLTDATVKLSYSINGEAGLSILDFVSKFLVADSEDSSTQLADSSENPLTSLTSTVGLTADEAAAITSGSPASMADVRNLSSRFAKLQKSWTTICTVLPKSVFDTVFESESEELKEIFQITECKDGLAEGQTVRSAALFAAALQFMSQAAGLFQTVLDADGNNEIDIAEQGTAAIAKLNTLQTETSSISDASTVNAADFSSNLSAINTQLEEIRQLREQITGEIVNYTLACFTFVTVLIANIPNIPKQIALKIEKAANQINEGRAKLVQYTSVDASSSSSDQGKKVKEAAEKAAKTIDDLYAKVDAIEDPVAKQERLDQLNAEKDKVCTNFEATKTEFNLPADVTAPENCATAASLTGTPARVAGGGFKLFKRIPLPSEMNPNLDAAEPTDGSTQLNSPLEFREDLLELMHFGEGIRTQ